ncbi:Oidioi.mRNA.OKI2018_I69.XSR.g15226.t1.cds [Oikopleura dioica]|uniref:Oidioi.mRNA.OKI2018_I69.XSR.g15226.t1.cds n=1 Tax=Oikopleura dioica TaxID=34765 RepID=A0ABN7SH96_OIKDI|nr:Oidioi.mRNA.OKI2018_I69.XSR.g15226.t1.cds [Oikopleura dioica]
MRISQILFFINKSLAQDDFFGDFSSVEETRGSHLRNLLGEVLNAVGSEHEADSFFEYGCWCFSSPRANRHDFTKGRSQPVDEIDRVCRDIAYCHMCLAIDFDEKCDFYQEYNYTITNGGMECVETENSCAWAACQCDKNFITQITEKEGLWDARNNVRGGFVTGLF